MTPDQLQFLVLEALDDGKGQDVLALDVAHLTTIADHMIIATGTSARHVKALAQRVLDAAREQGIRPLGVEGREDAQWVLLDLGAVIVHVMQESARSYYDLERLWQDVPVPEPSATGVSNVVPLSEAVLR